VQTTPWVQNLTQLKKCLISTCFTFVQIYELYGYGQYKMHGSFINVLANVNQTQSIWPHVSTKSLSNNWCVPKAMIEYKLFYITWNVNHDHVQFMTFN